MMKLAKFLVIVKVRVSGGVGGRVRREGWKEEKEAVCWGLPSKL